MFRGQKAAAVDAVVRRKDEGAYEVVRSCPDIFETFLAAAPHVYIRLCRWDEILDLAQPEGIELYVTTNALIFYAKAVALTNPGVCNANGIFQT